MNIITGLIDKNTMSNINIVLKTVERCNLNCSYCYFFNGSDKTYQKRPKFIKKEIIDSLAIFLKNGAEDIGIKNINVVLHGGEPLMQPKEDFIYLIEKLRSSLSGMGLFFSLQTNATLVTQKWIDLLNRYEVGVGVSIDGPIEYHDLYRVDHNGNGSYEGVIRGIKLLQSKLKHPPGCLTVINSQFSGAKIYRHLIELGFLNIDFLLPDYNYFLSSSQSLAKYTEFLLEVFNEWTKDNNAAISIRIFQNMILQLLGEESLIYGFGKPTASNMPSLTVRSDGEITPSDELVSTNTDIMFNNKFVTNTTLPEILSQPVFAQLKEAQTHAPDKCSRCCWYNACGAGGLGNRYSKEKGFNNPSIYCDTYQEIFGQIASYMIKSGISKDTITNNLLKNREFASLVPA